MARNENKEHQAVSSFRPVVMSSIIPHFLAILLLSYKGREKRVEVSSLRKISTYERCDCYGPLLSLELSTRRLTNATDTHGQKFLFLTPRGA